MYMYAIDLLSVLFTPCMSIALPTDYIIVLKPQYIAIVLLYSQHIKVSEQFIINVGQLWQDVISSNT